MADTYPCPNRVVPRIVPCLDGADPDQGLIHAYDLIDIVTDRVNQFKGLMGETSIARIRRATTAGWPAIDRHTLMSGGTTPGGGFDGIASYVNNVLFASGYVYKQTKDQSYNLWPVPPDNRSDVALLRSCHAFWLNWDEVYACLEDPDTGQALNAALRKCTFDNCGGCPSEPAITKTAWKHFIMSLQCMANYACYPSCMCPLCSRGGCGACARCMTVQVQFDGVTALMALPAGEGCILDFDMIGVFRDGEGLDSTEYPLCTCHVNLARGYLVYVVNITKILEDSTRIILTHQPRRIDFGISDPGDACADIPSHGQLLVDQMEDVYYYDQSSEPAQTYFMGSARVCMASGFPIYSHPWDGVNRYYTLGMGDIPECDICGHSGLPAQSGRMSFSGGGFSIDTAGSHLGRTFDADITFDYSKCAYGLDLKCEVGTYWRGLSFTCGGPAGTYLPDPDFIIVFPCSTPPASVIVTEGG
jgi:hypothetical protein